MAGDAVFFSSVCLLFVTGHIISDSTYYYILRIHIFILILFAQRIFVRKTNISSNWFKSKQGWAIFVCLFIFKEYYSYDLLPLKWPRGDCDLYFCFFIYKILHGHFDLSFFLLLIIEFCQVFITVYTLYSIH